ncbi:hypothetical protein BJ878DRAFT_455843 [Calycina marina]|uniref:Rad4-domain-containing protein n=1 Tax=Calycina marina TaxID=1763456 RepID=A0A9P7Z7E5_9HELO|nr:hypothetical protein BJ878DRAFT_455843 [Calycina marina]
MSGRATRSRKGKGVSLRNLVAVPFQEMLAETLPHQAAVPDRPLKRRKISRRTGNEQPSSVTDPKSAPVITNQEFNDDEDHEFEDVLIGKPLYASDDEGPRKELQTACRDTDDETEDGAYDVDLDAIDFDIAPSDSEHETPSRSNGTLELNFSRHRSKSPDPSSAVKRCPANRRKTLSKEERELRLQVHKMHVLCLMAYAERRNEFCNDYAVQKLLRPLITNKIMAYLRPDEALDDFGRANALKRGLEELGTLWSKRFTVVETGMRRALWAGKEGDVGNHQPFPTEDSCWEQADFLKAARKLEGSRDAGAQLYVAMLRSAGVECRLVCSLQPLSFSGGGPAMILFKGKKPPPKAPEAQKPVEVDYTNFKFAQPGDPIENTPTARRLGHSGTPDYSLSRIMAYNSIPSSSPRAVRSTNGPSAPESHYPIFWLEALDHAHNKWLSVDPMVTCTINKPRAIEPSLQDAYNNMLYVLAFSDDGTARDVTRRYAKAFNAKTRKLRVESTPGGRRWWQKALKRYDRGWLGKSIYDEAEDNQLAAFEAQEPMPKNIIDFKDHPIYALERHLKKNQILISGKVIGKVATGKDPARPGQKKTENVFRRSDVRAVKSADAWYRMGRDVKMGEQPVKTVPAKARADDDDDDGVDERPGTNLYTEEQTELYAPPPVVDGRIPKNTFGNIDIYVPSMVPAGGVHIKAEETVTAARLLGIDYSAALTGFSFRGRHGTAILQGAVVAAEFREAVEAVIEGFHDERARREEEMRSLRALRMWKRFVAVLRVKETVAGYAESYEAVTDLADDGEEKGEDKLEDDGKSEETEEYGDDDFSGGGFIPQ